MKNAYSNGDQVQWTSQAGGCAKTKIGAVVQIVVAGTMPDWDGLMNKHNANARYGGGLTRNHTSYVVLVPSATGRGRPTLYWPVASGLSKVAA
jgi:hypothetical protein